MSDPADKQENWLAGLRRAFDSLLGLAQNRFEIFTIELQEEKLRTLNLLVRIGIALMLGGAGLLVAMGAVALFLWHIAGYAGLIGLAIAAIAGAAAVFQKVRREIQDSPPPFSSTVAEFRKDRECLRSKD